MPDVHVTERPEIAIYQPSFGAVGGAELLAVAETRALRASGMNARIVTESVDVDRWRDELRDVPISACARPSALRAFPWTVRARYGARAHVAKPLLVKSDVVIALNYPSNAMLGAMQLGGVRLWQVNEPSRQLYLPDTHPTLTRRVELPTHGTDDWLSEHYATRLHAWRERLGRGGKLAAKRQFDSAMTARLDGIFAISRYAQAMTRQIYGRCSDTIVYPCVLQSVQPTSARYGIRRHALQILAQSRLEPIKNVETVIRGFAAFAMRSPGAVLHVVGEGRDTERLQGISNHIAPGRVQFHGFLSSSALESLTAQCDVFALLPVDEPFGMVFTEAMSRGLLCVGPDHGGPSEILEDGKLGWTVDAFSVDAVRNAFDVILASSDVELDARRGAASASVERRFSERAMVESLLNVLREHHVPL